VAGGVFHGILYHLVSSCQEDFLVPFWEIDKVIFRLPILGSKAAALRLRQDFKTERRGTSPAIVVSPG
jgi:hypothetical protein